MATRRQSRSLLFYLFALVALAAFLAFQHFYVSRVSFAEEEISSLTSLQEKELGIFLDMNHLLATLATLVLGGMGAFLFNRYKTGELPWYQVRRAVGCWIFCGLSLYSGYLSYEQVLWMLQNKFFNLSNPQIVWPSRSQFWAFAASVFFFADFVYRGLRKDSSREKEAKKEETKT